MRRPLINAGWGKGIVDRCSSETVSSEGLLRVGVLSTGEGSLGKVQEVSAEEGKKKNRLCRWEADGCITDRHGHLLTQWNKETSGGAELFYVAIIS